jgi:ABC-type transporter Mla subunit MlaD
MVDKVAEATERIAEDVAETFPENKNLQKAASKIKAVSDEIEENVDKAEALLQKVRTAY